MAQTAQYDHIGSKYDEYARTATLKRAESYTFFRMVGALGGQARPGSGLRLRLLYAAVQATRRGAGDRRRYLAGDGPPGARSRSRQSRSASRIRWATPWPSPRSGAFDLVTAVYLLNYATSKDQMLGMCRSAYDNLVAGGRFVAYTVNPAFTLSKPNSTKYGVTMLRQMPEEDRYLCDVEFVTDPPTPYQHPQWSQATHEWAIKEAGFRDVRLAPLGGGPGRRGALWGSVLARFLRQLPGHRAGLPEVTWTGWRDTMSISDEPNRGGNHGGPASDHHQRSRTPS